MAISHISTLVLFLLFLCLSPLSFSERCHPNDKKALLQIKKDLNNPQSIITWKPDSDCCSGWEGIYCNEKNRTHQLGIPEYSNLHLPIPAAVGDLPFLYTLTFYRTNVTGKIPAALSKLTNLAILDLGQNLLTGPVPDFLKLLKSATLIDLSSNMLTGSIPASLSQLPELSSLTLDRNKLTGTIPESFAVFGLDFHLGLSYNQLSGTFPRKLGAVNFRSIDVSGNRLEGDLSFLFGKNKRLMDAYFSRNKFEFDFSKVVISDMLRNLDLSHNKIYGSIPLKLAMVDLITLNVSYNSLCGKIPVGGRMQEFESMYIHNKCLCGSPLTTKCTKSS